MSKDQLLTKHAKLRLMRKLKRARDTISGKRLSDVHKRGKKYDAHVRRKSKEFQENTLWPHQKKVATEEYRIGKGQGSREKLKRLEAQDAENTTRLSRIRGRTWRSDAAFRRANAEHERALKKIVLGGGALGALGLAKLLSKSKKVALPAKKQSLISALKKHKGSLAIGGTSAAGLAALARGKKKPKGRK